MGALGRYIFRTTFGAFVLVLVSLTTVIWITQALRDIDVVTSQGQTILVFLGMTSLVIPQLVMIIAPIALMIAAAHVLNKLSTDSEIIVMNAAGMPPWRLFSGFLTVTLLVSALVAVVSAYVAPKSLRELRRMAAEIRADLVANIVQPGRFTSLERGLTFHIRERRADGLLLGIFVDDRRDPKEQATFLAEKGEILQNERGTFLILDTGSVQRHPAEDRDPTIVLFDRYAFDLSRFTGGAQAPTLSVRERYLWELV
jgi:lipopolysaccharide export system permease protein